MSNQDANNSAETRAFEAAKKSIGNCLTTLEGELFVLEEVAIQNYPEYDKDDVEWSVLGEANWNIAIAKQLVKLAVKHLSLAGEAVLIDEPQTSHHLPLAISVSDIASVYISTEGDPPRLFTVVEQKD